MTFRGGSAFRWPCQTVYACSIMYFVGVGVSMSSCLHACGRYLSLCFVSTLDSTRPISIPGVFLECLLLLNFFSTFYHEIEFILYNIDNLYIFRSPVLMHLIISTAWPL